MKKKIVTLCLAAALAVTAIGGTLAYFTDGTQTTVNTFTVGDVEITLDEAKVNEYGVKEGDIRVTAGNEYKLIPGHTYVKDPTVTVAADSEECYVRMFVTVSKTDLDKLVAAFPTFVDNGIFDLENLVNGWDRNVWECVSATDGVYEFRYHETVNTVGLAAEELPALFTEIKVPTDITDETLSTLKDVKINIYAEAIQADGFNNNADAAFAALTAQGTN